MRSRSDALDFRPSSVLERSPLSLKAVNFILAAPKLPLPADAQVLEAWRLALVLLGWEAVDIQLHSRSASLDGKRRVMQALRDLKKASDRLRFTSAQPPELPADYLVEMQKWEESTGNHSRQSNEHQTLPILLTFYRGIFDRRPSGSETGPTFRFVSRFLLEMETVFQTANWLEAPEPSTSPPAIKDMFRMPPAATLRSQIDRDSRTTPAVEAHVKGMFWTMYRQVIGAPTMPGFLQHDGGRQPTHHSRSSVPMGNRPSFYPQFPMGEWGAKGPVD